MAAQPAIAVYGGVRIVTISTTITIPNTPATITLNWPPPPVLQQMQYTSLASPLGPASRYFPNPIPVLTLTEIDGAVMDTAGALITTATRLRSVPTNVYFASDGTEVPVTDCNSSQWACWSSGKKGGVVIGSACAALLLVFVVVCCYSATRRRGSRIFDEESGLENSELGGSSVPNIVRQRSEKRQRRSWLRSGAEYSLMPRVKQSRMVPLSDTSTLSLSSTMSRDAKPMDNCSNLQLGRRLAASHIHQVWQDSPRLSREPSARVTRGYPTPGSSYDPLKTSREVHGVPRDNTSQLVRQNREHPPRSNHRPRRGFFLPGPHKNMVRAQVRPIPSPLRRELRSSDISSSVGSILSPRDSISSLERR
jgi:hypothetical protein